MECYVCQKNAIVFEEVFEKILFNRFEYFWFYLNTYAPYFIKRNINRSENSRLMIVNQISKKVQTKIKISLRSKKHFLILPIPYYDTV